MKQSELIIPVTPPLAQRRDVARGYGRNHQRQKGTAFHEAGHAVARVVVGACLTRTEITGSEGLSHGTGEVWQCSSYAQYAAWDYITYCLAGPYAEARAMRRCRLTVTLTVGHADYKNADDTVEWLVSRGHATSNESGWLRGHRETIEFIKEHWSKIERVADALLRHGELEPEDLRKLLELE